MNEPNRQKKRPHARAFGNTAFLYGHAAIFIAQTSVS
jgi:hypothetical protein